MEKKDVKHLRNMLEAAKDGVGFSKTRTRTDLDRDRQLTLSLLKSLEMIGMAAARVSKACQNGCEPIPWKQVIEMKQEVVHTYWEIDRDWVWDRVTRDLPPLIEALENVLTSEQD